MSHESSAERTFWQREKPSFSQVLLIHSSVNKGKRWAFSSSDSFCTFPSLQFSLVCRANNTRSNCPRLHDLNCGLTHSQSIPCKLYSFTISIRNILLFSLLLQNCWRWQREQFPSVCWQRGEGKGRAMRDDAQSAPSTIAHLLFVPSYFTRTTSTKTHFEFQIGCYLHEFEWDR